MKTLLNTYELKASPTKLIKNKTNKLALQNICTRTEPWLDCRLLSHKELSSIAHPGYWPAIPRDQPAWTAQGFPIKCRVKRCTAALPSSKAIYSLQSQAAACADTIQGCEDERWHLLVIIYRLLLTGTARRGGKKRNSKTKPQHISVTRDDHLTFAFFPPPSLLSPPTVCKFKKSRLLLGFFKNSTFATRIPVNRRKKRKKKGIQGSLSFTGALFLVFFFYKYLYSLLGRESLASDLHYI